jgi:glycosyltransferase involved in cell wall biosynthesis
MAKSRENPEAWLLSAYAADSHRAWAEWVVGSQTQFAWRRFELPGRHFRWRIRGNPLSWLDALPATRPALILASSMVDLATLKGLLPHLAAVPSIYYFHENQFAYPCGDRQFNSVDPQMVQLYGALAADSVVFNSVFNRDSFLQGVTGLMARMPDGVPADLAGRLARRSVVCPVPIQPIAAGDERDPQLIVWPHRWEYDKAPERFADAMLALAARGVGFRLALLGKRPATVPDALGRLRQALGDRIVADGRLPRADYEGLIGRAAVAVSTAIHEFQGLGMLEAASAGVRPLVPDALCYPEQYGAAYRYPVGDPARLVGRLERWLTGRLPPAVDVSAWYPAVSAERWRRLLGEGQHEQVE